MKNNQILAFCIKTFFWVFGLYIFGMIFVFSYFFPTFLRIGHETGRLVDIILYIFSSVGVLILLYFYIYRHTFVGNKTDLIIRIFLLALFIIPELITSISSLNFNQGLLMNILAPLSLVIISLLLLFPQKVISINTKEIRFTHKINESRFFRLFILGACYSILLICVIIFVDLIIHPTFDKNYALFHVAILMHVLPALYPILYKKSWVAPLAKIILPFVLIGLIIFNIWVELSLITLIPFILIIFSLLYIYKDKLRSLFLSKKINPSTLQN